MPRLLDPPESSLSKAHKTVTKQLLRQYENGGVVAETAANSAQDVIDVLDEAVSYSEVLLNDADDLRFKLQTTSRSAKTSTIPSSSIANIMQLARDSQIKLGGFDAKSISAVTNSNIQARLDNLSSLIDALNQSVVFQPPLATEGVRHFVSSINKATAKLAEIVSFIKNKLRVSGKLSGGSLSNSYAF